MPARLTVFNRLNNIKINIRYFLGFIRNQIVKIFNVFPLTDTILFESNPDFNDESFWICKYLIENNKINSKHIVWILKDRESVFRIPNDWPVDYIFIYPKCISEWIKKYYLLHTSKYIMDSCSFVNKRRAKQIRFFLCHFGMHIKNAKKYMAKIGQYDYVSCGFIHFKSQFEAFGIPLNKMVFLGNARLDRLKNNNQLLSSIIPRAQDYTKRIIWMPTYRQHNTAPNNGCSIKKSDKNQTGFPILYTTEDFTIINDILSRLNYLLVIKLHPSQDCSFLIFNNYSNIKLLKNTDFEKSNIQLYDVINNFDALITDYSSIYYDFLLLERPIALTLDDIDVYRDKVGFAIDDYEKEIKGEYINTITDMISFFENINNYDLDKIINAKNDYYDCIDCNYTKRLCDFICKNIFA